MTSLVIGRRKRAQLLVVMAASMLAVAGQTADESGAPSDAEGHPVSISAMAFQPRTGNEAAPFTRYDGSLFGLQQTSTFSPADFFPPFFNGGGISSGDIDRDGWPDVVSANGPQIGIFMNQGGQRFERLEVDITGDNDSAIFNVALVDLNGDGWLDLFGTSYLD